MSKRALAFVLGGGGARGALQVGAIRALLEAGLLPDLLVGTSIGACNAAFLALNGVNPAGLDKLEAVWRDAVTADLLPANYWWVTLRSVLRPQVNTHSEGRLRAFYLAHGLRPEQMFGEIQDSRLFVVSTDLNSGQAVVHGADPEESIYQAVLASTALPPWIHPVRRNGRLLIDGGFLSNLPIEAAVNQGATEIIALDLSDPSPVLAARTPGIRPGLSKLAASVQLRQLDLELRLAAAYGVPVQKIDLYLAPPLAVWNFHRTEELLAVGYELARAALVHRAPSNRTRWWTPRDWLVRSTARVQRRRAA